MLQDGIIFFYILRFAFCHGAFVSRNLLRTDLELHLFAVAHRTAALKHNLVAVFRSDIIIAVIKGAAGQNYTGDVGTFPVLIVSIIKGNLAGNLLHTRCMSQRDRPGVFILLAGADLGKIGGYPVFSGYYLSIRHRNRIGNQLFRIRIAKRKIHKAALPEIRRTHHKICIRRSAVCHKGNAHLFRTKSVSVVSILPYQIHIYIRIPGDIGVADRTASPEHTGRLCIGYLEFLLALAGPVHKHSRLCIQYQTAIRRFLKNTEGLLPGRADRGKLCLPVILRLYADTLHGLPVFFSFRAALQRSVYRGRILLLFCIPGDLHREVLTERNIQRRFGKDRHPRIVVCIIHGMAAAPSMRNRLAILIQIIGSGTAILYGLAGRRELPDTISAATLLDDGGKLTLPVVLPGQLQRFHSCPRLVLGALFLKRYSDLLRTKVISLFPDNLNRECHLNGRIPQPDLRSCIRDGVIHMLIDCIQIDASLPGHAVDRLRIIRILISRCVNNAFHLIDKAESPLPFR